MRTILLCLFLCTLMNIYSQNRRVTYLSGQAIEQNEIYTVYSSYQMTQSGKAKNVFEFISKYDTTRRFIWRHTIKYKYRPFTLFDIYIEEKEVVCFFSTYTGKDRTEGLYIVGFDKETGKELWNRSISFINVTAHPIQSYKRGYLIWVESEEKKTLSLYYMNANREIMLKDKLVSNGEGIRLGRLYKTNNHIYAACNIVEKNEKTCCPIYDYVYCIYRVDSSLTLGKSVISLHSQQDSIISTDRENYLFEQDDKLYIHLNYSRCVESKANGKTICKNDSNTTSYDIESLSSNVLTFDTISYKQLDILPQMPQKQPLSISPRNKGDAYLISKGGNLIYVKYYLNHIDENPLY